MSGQHPVFIPGPTNIPDRLRNVMSIQTIDHRSSRFAELFLPVLEDMKKVFKTTDGQVLTYPSSGTGGWEAAISNTLSPGDKVLAARHGMFSHRWIDLCQRHGLEVEVIDCEWGTGAPSDLFEEHLSEDSGHQIKAVLVTHNETATGVKSDVKAVRDAMSATNHPAMLFVDCVSSLASMDFRMDEWGVDIAVSGSQKGLMLATGIALLGVSPKALKASESASCPRTFFDFKDMLNSNRSGGYPYTPPLQLLYGLKESLDMLFEEGLENVFSRHRRIAAGVREAIKAWGLKLCAKSPELYSDTVSAIWVPEGFDSNALTDRLLNTYAVSFGIGLGPLDGKVFRIGHLGAMTDMVMLSGIAVTEMAMADLGYPIELGSGTRAAQEYYRRTASQSS